MGGPTLSGGERLSGPIPTLRMVKPVLALVILNLSVALSLASVRHGVSRPPVPTMKFSGPVWLNQRPSVLGLAGGIASGKSTVSKVLANCGGMKVIDADRLGHESYMPGTRCFNNLVYEFGEQIVGEDGTIDRRALGEAVFGDPLNMIRLQDIVWPEIRILAEKKIEKLRKEGTELVVFEAAVLLEAEWDDMCDELWVVQVPPVLASARLMKRNGLDKEQAEKRINSQPMTDEDRAARAAVVVSNGGTEEELTKKVKQAWSSRSGGLRRKRRRQQSLAFLGVAAIAGAALIAAASIILRRGRGLR